jgi:hypothetical protein
VLELAGRPGTGLRWGAFVAALGIVGCSPSFRATYDTTTVRRVAGPRLDVALDLDVLRDARRQHAASGVLFRGEREAEIDGEASCVNAEASYEAGVARQVTDTVALHMRRRGVLREVTVGSAGRAHYRLSGEIGALYGVQETSGQAQAGAAVGGLIGGIIAATASEPTRVRIVFQNLAIHDSTGRLVARPADVVLDFSGELAADAYCHSVYANVNEKLREAVHQLAANVEAALWQARSGHGPGQASRAPSPPPPNAAALAALEAKRRAEREAMRESALSSWEADHEAWQREVAQTEDARAPLTTWMWVAAGAGAVLVGTGIYFELRAHDAHDDAQAQARLWSTTPRAAERAELEARIAESESDRDTFATLGGVSLAVGGASLATSLVLLVVRPGLPEEPVRPVAGRDELGLVVRGSF